MTADRSELVVERRINASPTTVFSFFTDRDRWLSWQGVEAEIDPRPGGVFRMNVQGDSVTAGHLVTVEPYRRIVFTWGVGDRRQPRPARFEHGRHHPGTRRAGHVAPADPPWPATRDVQVA